MPGSRTGPVSRVAFVAAALLLGVAGCSVEEPGPGTMVAAADTATRAARRAYDGAPPVIPHPPLGTDCIACHTRSGRSTPPLGFAPPNPHLATASLSLGASANCRQCHVFSQTEKLFKQNEFQGIPQRPQPAERLFSGAPPVIPHRVFMRENCLACHAGQAARQEIVCSHPERTNCRQCHVSRNTTDLFVETSAN